MQNIPSSNVYELSVTCNKTNLKRTLCFPNHSKPKLEKDLEMYARHAPSNVTLLMSQRDIITRPLTHIEKNDINDTTPHCFDSNGYQGSTNFLAFKLSEEKTYVTDVFLMHGDRMFRENVNIIPCVELVGSLWHKGFVNVLFDGTHCSYMHKVWSWIEDIGNVYNPEVLKTLTLAGIGSHSIYKNAFFTENVVRLCEYCQLVFGVDKYETSKLFAKRDIPEITLDPKAYIPSQAQKLTHVAAIYAEHGNVRKAREYYKKSIAILEGENCRCNYVRTFENFEAYVEKNGTSVLSSYF